MILQNAYNYIKNLSLAGGSTSSSNNYTFTPVYPIVDTNGSALTAISMYATGNSSGFKGQILPFMQSSIGVGNYTSTVTSLYFSFGTGTTPVTSSDYALENRITSGLSMNTTYGTSGTTLNIAVDENEKSITKTMLYFFILKNTSDSDITITEIGASSGIYYSNSSAKSILFYREVLDTPFTIPAGSNKTMSFEFAIKHIEG